jgi:4-diphosphocytidyl-2-C-methyl-D-erythritol kinase
MVPAASDTLGMEPTIPLTDDSGAGPWPAPAKLNLMLRILGRRPDGYHELQTVFHFLDYGDALYFEPRADGLIRRHGGSAAVAPEADLVVRAARLLQSHSPRHLGVDIHLEKRLPLGGGLGGGSSDAATTLLVLNRLWGLGLDTPTLAALGLRLGADVPLFVQGHTAWGEGVGERLTPILLPEVWYLVLIPDCQVATAAVFGADELTRDSPRRKIADFLAGDAVNDCQSLVARRYPPVAEALNWLGRYAAARLTGTGACVFAAFAAEAEARQLLQAKPAQFAGFVAQGRNRSPLLTRLGG